MNHIRKLIDGLRTHVDIETSNVLDRVEAKKYLTRCQVNGLGIKGEFLLVQISMIEL